MLCNLSCFQFLELNIPKGFKRIYVVDSMKITKTLVAVENHHYRTLMQFFGWYNKNLICVCVCEEERVKWDQVMCLHSSLFSSSLVKHVAQGNVTQLSNYSFYLFVKLWKITNFELSIT